MGIDNISNSNSINRNLIELNKDLSQEEKVKLLSIFDAVDEQEEDNQKGTITTFDSMQKFLGQIKENIGDKYNKFLDSVNLSFLKNDKNTNGVIDENDFSPEQWSKMMNIAPFLAKATWTKDIDNLLQRIFNNNGSANDSNKEIIVDKGDYKYAVLFDDEKRIFKSVMINGGNEYGGYYIEYQLNEKGEATKSITVDINSHYTSPDGKNVKISYPLFNDFVVSRGFKQHQEPKYTPDEVEQRIELWKDSGAWFEDTN